MWCRYHDIIYEYYNNTITATIALRIRFAAIGRCPIRSIIVGAIIRASRPCCVYRTTMALLFRYIPEILYNTVIPTVIIIIITIIVVSLSLHPLPLTPPTVACRKGSVGTPHTTYIGTRTARRARPVTFPAQQIRHPANRRYIRT